MNGIYDRNTQSTDLEQTHIKSASSWSRCTINCDARSVHQICNTVFFSTSTVVTRKCRKITLYVHRLCCYDLNCVSSGGLYHLVIVYVVEVGRPCM